MAISWTAENASQETINAWTHGLGCLASVPAGLALSKLALERREQLFFACVAYSLSLTAMYLFSTLSHAVKPPLWRHRVRAWDQGMIYVLIAGTFTPFIWGFMTGWPRVGLMLFVWLAAAAGFYSKVFASHRINNMTSGSYILLGWIPAMILFSYVPLECFGLMLLGGVFYTAGVYFLQNDHRAWYFHAIWHSLVIVASACHYISITLFPVLQLEIG